MSCDGNRARFFGVLAPTLAPLVGGEAQARALLETLYDVASNQPAPEDKAGQLAAAAATRRMMVRAMNGAGAINLYPHPSSTGLPAPEAQAAWRQVSDLLAAVEKGTPLPPLAADVQQMVAFTGVTAAPVTAWNVPVSSQTRQGLRLLWADDPQRVSLLVCWPDMLARPEHAAHLAEMTRLLAADPEAPPHLAAAARYAQALDDEGMLDGAARVRWMQTLGAVAGVGVGPGSTARCAECGASHQPEQRTCAPEDIVHLGAMAAAVAEVLADPEHILDDPDPGPHEMMERLLWPWTLSRVPPTPGGALGRLLAVAQARDADFIERKAQAVACGDRGGGGVGAITAATLRRPLLFDGVPHVWEQGNLTPLDTWLMLDAEARAGTPRPQHEIDRLHTASVRPDALLLMMTGRPAPAAVRFDFAEQARRFGREPDPTPLNALARHQLIDLGCPHGCIYCCTDLASRMTQGRLERVSGFECPTHEHVIGFKRGGKQITGHRVDLTQPLFAMPTWPEAERGGV